MKDTVQQNKAVLGDVAFRRRDRLPLEVEVLRLEELLTRRLPHDLTHPQRIHFHALLLIEEGESFHEIDFERYPAGPGHVLMVPAMHVQAFAPGRGLRGSMLLFTPAFLDTCGLHIHRMPEAGRAVTAAGPHVGLGKTSFSRLKEALAQLDACTKESRARFSKETVEAAFALLVFRLAGLPEIQAVTESQRSQDPLVERFLDMLEDRFPRQHQASYYAKALHVSLRSLDRHMVEAQSQTTRQAISSRLLLEAKRLLTERDMLIKHIAIDLGFSEPQNFTRFFRTHTGLSPESFRRNLD